MSSFQRLGLHRAIAYIALLGLAGAARAQDTSFKDTNTGVGPFDYNNPANWVGGIIDGQINHTPGADQTITFGMFTTLTNGLQFTLGGTNSLTLRSDGSSDRSLSLLSDLVVAGTADVIIGSSSANQGLSIFLDVAQRNFSVAAGRTLTVLNSVTGSTGAAVNKYGTGRWILAGAGSYMDPTRIYEGTLQLGDGLTNGTLLGGLVVESGATVDVHVADATTTSFGTVISGGGNLTTTGTGTLELSAANTYSGGTQIAAGKLIALNDSGSATGAGSVAIASGATLKIGDSSYFGKGAVAGNITNDGTLQIDRPDIFTFSNSISGIGAVKFGYGSTRIVTLTGANTYSGATTIVEGQVGDGAPGAFSSSSTFALNSGSTLAVNFNETIGGLTNGTMGSGIISLASGATLTVDTSATTTFSGLIFGTGSFAKAGSGTLTLAGTTSSYSGGTTIKGGVLEIASDSSLGDSTSSLVFDGGALRLTTTYTSSRSITLNSGGGTIKTNAFQATVNGVISGSGHLTHEGTGILTLAGANTYGGGTTVQGGGVLDFTADANLGVTSSAVTLNGGDLRTRAAIADFTHDIFLASSGGSINTYGLASTFSGQITGPGWLSVKSQNAGGILTLINGSNQYAGPTYLESGTLRVGATNALPTDNVVKIRSGALLDVGFDQVLSAINNYGAGDVGSVTIAEGKTLTVGRTANDLFEGVISGAGVFTKQGSGLLTLGGNSSAFTGLVNVTAGTLQIGGTAGLLGGSFSLSGGATLEFGRTDATTVTSSTSIAGTGTIKKSGASVLEFDSFSSFSGFSGALIVSGGAVSFPGGGSIPAVGVSVLSGATLAVGVETSLTAGGLDGSGTVVIDTIGSLVLAPTTNHSFSGAITGAGGLMIDGTNAQRLTGANSYTGQTEITGGTLELTDSGAIGNSLVRIDSGGTLKVTGASAAIGGLADYSSGISGTLYIGAPGLLQVVAAAASTFSGSFDGDGELTKEGAGALTFAGGSSFTGRVNLNAGSIIVGSTNAITSSRLTVESGASFDVANSTRLGILSGSGTTTIAAGKTLTLTTPQMLAPVITGAGGVTFTNDNLSTGVTSILSNQTYTGPTTVTAGTLQLGAADLGVTTGSVIGNIVTSAGTKVVFNRGNTNFSFSGTISGGGSVWKQGSGTLTLSGQNTFVGQTVVDNGTLKITVPDALPTDGTLFLGSGARLDVAASQIIRSFAGSLGALLTIQSGQVLNVKLGPSTAGTIFEGAMSGSGTFEVGSNDGNGHDVTLTGTNTYTGGTIIDAGGALRIGNGGTTGMVQGDITNHGLLIFDRSDPIVFNGVISGTGTVQQGKSAISGVDVLTLGAANTYSGGTHLYAGGLEALNSTGSATGSGFVMVHSGASLRGSGTVSGPVTIEPGGLIAPVVGASDPTTLTVGATTLMGGARFAFVIRDANGVSGTDMSLLSISGVLTIAATSADPFVISLYSLAGASPGLAANFDPQQSFRWTLMIASGGISGFDAAAFQVDTSQFQNPLSGGFGVVSTAGNVFLDYSPSIVPEPATWMLMTAGGLLVAAVEIRRRRAGRKTPGFKARGRIPH